MNTGETAACSLEAIKKTKKKTFHIQFRAFQVYTNLAG